MADELDLFVDGLEPVKLFEVLRDQCQPGHPWPILYLIGPHGAGKTTLTKHLNREMRHTIFPHIRINFQHENVPKKPLQILVTIRDEFHRHLDPNDFGLRFPRFDFGAALIRGAQEQGNAVLSPNEARTHIYRNSAVLDRWMEPTGALGNLVALMPPLMIVLKSAFDIEPISRFMQEIRDGVVWEWYKRQAPRLGVRSDQDIKVLMERLYELAREGESEELLEELLVEALFADLMAAFTPEDVTAPHAWPGADRAVIFFDNFDVLINTPGLVAERVLELLALHMAMKMRAPTILLLVVASELPLDGVPLPVRQPLRHAEIEMLRSTQSRFANWHRTLPQPHSSHVRLKDLLWPIELHSFNLDETRAYLQQYGRKHRLSNFEEDELLVDHIHKLSYGYPSCVHLIARAAQRTGHIHYTDTLENLSSGNKTIAGDLYERFMRPFDQEFQDQLIPCALPLALDKELLNELLDRSYIELERLWSRLQILPFIRVRRDGKLVFHPLVRHLLLMRFKPEETNRTYFQNHDRLQQYFERRNPQNSESLLASVYHTLLQGKVDAALELGRRLFQSDRNRWRELLSTVDSVPFGPGNFAVGRLQIGKRAVQAEQSFQRTTNSNDGADAILLYRWLLTEPLTDQEKEICWHGLDFCYAHLPGIVSREDAARALDHMVNLRDHQVRIQASAHSGAITTTLPASPPSSEDGRSAGQLGGVSGPRTNGRTPGPIQEGTPPMPLPPFQSSVPQSSPTSQPPNAAPVPLPNSNPGSTLRQPNTGPMPLPNPNFGPTSQPPNPGPTAPLPNSAFTPNRPWIKIMRKIFAQRQRRKPGNHNSFLILTIAVMFVGAVLCPLFLTSAQNQLAALLAPLAATPSPIIVNNPPTPSYPAPNSDGMGVTVQPGGEYIGLSNGLVAFDTAGRPDSLHKTLASNAFLRREWDHAKGLWRKAIGSSTEDKDNNDEPNDAEVQIYLQNQIVADRCVGVVVATDLSPNTGSGVTVGRDQLQGAYLVQRAQNDSTDRLKICLYIANVGNDPHNANKVAQQIVQAMPKYRIKAVVGWPTIDGSRGALQTLYNAHIPVVSADAYQHGRNVLLSLFHIIPSNEVEGQQDALYVEHSSQAHRIAILSSANEESDSYSAGLKDGFLQQLHNDKMDELVIYTHQYKEASDFSATMKQVAQKKPDLIYFTGGIDDAISMLANLTPGKFSDRLRVLGGHKLYQLVGYSGLRPSGIQFLDFSAGGYPDQGSVVEMKKHYAEYFDKGDPNTASPRVYGYSRPDNDVICSYNAMSVLLVALRSFGSSSQFQSTQLIDVLKQNQLQLIGTSQKVTTTVFNNFNEPTKPDLLIVRVDKDLHLQANSLIF